MQASRYIFLQTVVALLAITVALTIALWLTFSLRYLDYIVEDGLSLLDFLYMIALTLPRFLAVALPVALFCAVLFVYHKLIADSELVVLRASGFSDLKLAAPALVLSLFVAGAVALVNLVYAPVAARAFKDLQFLVRNNVAGMLVQSGVFRSLRPGVTFYVREQLQDQQFSGILIHDERNEAAPVTMMAEHGSITATPTGLRVFLVSGNRQQAHRDDGKVDILFFDRYTMDLALGGPSLDDRTRDNSEMSVGELLSASPMQFGKTWTKFYSDGHQRLASPLEAPAFAALAVAVLLVGEFNRRRSGRRVMLAALLGLLLKAGEMAAKPLAVNVPETVPLLYLITLCPLTGALLLLLRPSLRGIRPAMLPASSGA